jgi:C1A family cysteine protease
MLNATAGLIATAASYPYSSGSGAVGTCRPYGWTVGAKVLHSESLPRNEQAIAERVFTTGPVVVGVDATNLETYSGGVETNCNFSSYNDAFVLLGWNDAAPTPYWIVKTAWGTSFGENGFVYIQKGVNCLGIAGYGRTVRVATKAH